MNDNPMKTNPVIRFIVRMFASGLFFGYLPKIPGTWSTLGAALLYYFVFHLLFHIEKYPITYIIFIVIFTFFATGVTHLSLKWNLFPNPKNKDPNDPGECAIDEYVGFFIGTALLWDVHWQDVVAIFFIFRFFDILKPFPIYVMEKIRPAAFGIILDDVVAGIFTLIVWKLGVVAAYTLGIEWLIHF